MARHFAKTVIYCRCSTEEESQVDALWLSKGYWPKGCEEESLAAEVDSFVESRSGTTAEGEGNIFASSIKYNQISLM